MCVNYALLYTVKNYIKDTKNISARIVLLYGGDLKCARELRGVCVCEFQWKINSD